MKKLSILLIGLLLVAGLAVADGHIDVSGSASVTFGVDLNNTPVSTGFVNAGTSSVTLTLIEEGSGTTGGDDGLYGEISLTDWEFEIASTDGTATETYATGAVSAKIVVSPAEITIYSAPSFSLDMAPTIEAANEGSVSTSITGVNTIGGVTISVPAGPATVDLKVASDGGWEDNLNNDYGIGADIELAVAPATVDLGVLYGWFGTGATVGVSAGVELDIAPATITLGFDGDATGTFDFDIAAGAAVEIAEGADVSVDAYIWTGGATTDLDIELGFEEEKDGGLADMLYATLDVELLDLLDSGNVVWNVDVTGGYDTGDIDPYFGFGLGSDDVIDVNVGVNLKSGLTGIDNTTVTIDYNADDLTDVDPAIANNIGQISVKAEITY